MSNADLLPSLLFKINQNQLALEAAIMALTLWVEQRGSGEVGGNVRGALATISKKEDFINMMLAVCSRQHRIDLRADTRLTQLQLAEIQHRKWFASYQTGSVATR